MGHFHQKGFDKERERERSQQALEEHRLREEQFQKQKQKKTKKKRIIAAGIVLVLLLSLTGFVFYFLTPGIYDGFAQCITEQGAVMYGEDWCPNTQGQKAMFGKSFKYVNYQVKEDLRIRPTWVIDGKTYETVQSFQTLAALTGCKY